MRRYIDALANAAPTPGGGSASAVAGSMAAALVVMVCEVTLGKEKYQSVADELRNVRAKAEALKDQLVGLAGRDESAYDEVIKAFRLPKLTDGEKVLRRQEIQSALKRATDVPLETALACGQVLNLASQIVEKINPNALSDLGTAGLLAGAALKGARLNVIINASNLNDASFSHDAVSRVEALAEEAEKAQQEFQGRLSKLLV
jgi:methenyltetrahydrofolate cyclohydrolase